jgi:hypothetical protein
MLGSMQVPAGHQHQAAHQVVAPPLLRRLSSPEQVPSAHDDSSSMPMLPPRLTSSWSSGSDSMAVDGPFAAQLSAGCDVLFKRLAPSKPVSCVPEGEGLETAETAEPGFGVVPNEAAMSDGNNEAAAVPQFSPAAPEALSAAGAFAQLPPPQGDLLRRKRSLLDVAVASSPFGTRRNKECAYAAAPAAAVSAAVGVAADALAHMSEQELNVRQQQQQHLQRHQQQQQQHQQSHVFANSMALSTFAAAPPMVVPADFAFNSNASAMSLSASMFNSNVSMYNSNNSARSRCDSADSYGDSPGDGASRPRSRSMPLHVDVKREDSDMQVSFTQYHSCLAIYIHSFK